MKKMNQESEVIAGLQISDPVAFDFIFDRLYTPLCYFAYQLTDNLPEAEDIVLEAFQKFWERRNAFFTVVNIKAFLYITVRNTGLNYIRSNTKQQERTRELAYQQSDNVEKCVENSIVETEFINALYEKINNLPKKCRRVFILKYFDGLNVSEIADMLSLSEHTVRNHIAYSLKLLRNALGSQLLIISLLYLSGMQKTIDGDSSIPDYSDHCFFDSRNLEYTHINLTMIKN
ncbi:MAG: RNA polymerase sigma-70 factor [Chitinophagaceae bacterium]